MNTLQRLFCRKRAAFLLSLAFHTLLFGVVLYFVLRETPPKELEEPKPKALQMVSYNLQTPPPKTIQTPPPPKPVVPPKPKIPKKIEPKKPTPKRTVPVKKPEPKPQPKPEPIVQTPPKELEQKPLEPVVQTPPPQKTPPPPEPVVEQKTPQQLSQEYSETNFGVLRDMALKNLIYPRVAKKMGWSGVVEIKLVVGTDGKLLGATVHKSSGRELLDKSALKAALALKNEKLPKPDARSEIILPIAFRME